ncbi:DUF294 nucleotidyltransferase-like domain-containing protein [Aestuariimicrobium ganziense]|uniref:DUF294 nucleotidyltransferase-like domain-containing protein n=1 Tax=Aestuariimicrobium ganziense TaxID=2773677 RepID=UPI00194203A4|nr:DUF294 nucleotidyltransferase-like domain-containing protein [Aestuariimicrobium ganziense]
MDVELVEVADFLRRHAPFADLPGPLLNRLVQQSRIRYHRRGTVLYRHGEPNNSLHVVRSGGVDLNGADGVLVERVEPGGSFGTSSLLAQTASAVTVTAIEDTLVVVFPGDVVRQVAEDDATFAAHYTSTAQKRLQGANRHNLSRGGISMGREPSLSRTVESILGRAPVTASSEVSIQQAAATMSEHRVSALLLVDDDGHLEGIVTDRDLRSKVVAAGADTSAPVRTIMTADPVTTTPHTRAFEVLLEMTGRNFHHLPVVADGRPIGLVSSGDVMRLERSHPISLTSQINRQTTVAGVAEVARRIPGVVATYSDQHVSADEITRLLSTLADSLTRKLIALVEAEIGPAPQPWCWVAMGSQARHEQGLASDQDHAIITADTTDDDGWFAELAARVVDGLEACGQPRCAGDAMATNPRWRVSLAQWRRQFSQWIQQPGSEQVLHAQIFFDMRVVHGETSLLDDLRQAVVTQAAGNQRFLGHMAAMAVERTPPLGFFKGFVLEKGGEHADTFDIKAGGLHGVIELARVHALANGVVEVGTTDRLVAVAHVGGLSQEGAEELVEAFEFLSHVRLTHQAAQVRAGEGPDNHVRPDLLTGFEQRHLKEAFGVVSAAQKALAQRYQTHLMN